MQRSYQCHYNHCCKMQFFIGKNECRLPVQLERVIIALLNPMQWSKLSQEREERVIGRTFKIDLSLLHLCGIIPFARDSFINWN